MTKESGGKPAIREAVGAFAGGVGLTEAIDELVSAGFEREELGLLAGEYTVQKDLGDLYTRTNASAGDPHAPNTAFVAKESIGDTVHAYLGGLFFAGSTVTVGAAVASAAVLGGGLIAGITGAAAVAAIGAVLALIVHESDAEELEQQVEEGHVLLFVRTLDAAQEADAVRILEKHTPIEVKLLSAPDRGENVA
jgi:hypothetical protein